MERWQGPFGGRASTGVGRGPPGTEGRTAPDSEGIDLSHRKAEHVKVVLEVPVEGRYRYWNDVQLYHNALPEIDFDEIDCSQVLLGKQLSAPLMITGMTGGFPDAEKINDNLSRAAAELGLAMGVG